MARQAFASPCDRCGRPYNRLRKAADWNDPECVQYLCPRCYPEWKAEQMAEAAAMAAYLLRGAR